MKWVCTTRTRTGQNQTRKVNHESTKERKHEKRRPKFRAFQPSCFRDGKKFGHKIQKKLHL